MNHAAHITTIRDNRAAFRRIQKEPVLDADTLSRERGIVVAPPEQGRDGGNAAHKQNKFPSSAKRQLEGGSTEGGSPEESKSGVVPAVAGSAQINRLRQLIRDRDSEHIALLNVLQPPHNLEPSAQKDESAHRHFRDAFSYESTTKHVRNIVNHFKRVLRRRPLEELASESPTSPSSSCSIAPSAGDSRFRQFPLKDTSDLLEDMYSSETRYFSGRSSSGVQSSCMDHDGTDAGYGHWRATFCQGQDEHSDSGTLQRQAKSLHETNSCGEGSGSGEEHVPTKHASLEGDDHLMINHAAEDFSNHTDDVRNIRNNFRRIPCRRPQEQLTSGSSTLPSSSCRIASSARVYRSRPFPLNDTFDLLEDSD